MNKQRYILHTMFVISHQLKKDFKSFVGEHKLTEREAKFLYFIGTKSNKVSDLIEHFQKHKSTIRQKTRALEDKGYLLTGINPKDKRERILSLTKKGKSFVDMMSGLEKKYHKQVFSQFTEEEKKAFITLLDKISITTDDHEIIC